MISHRTCTSVLILVGIAGVVACGSSDSGDKYPEYSDFCEARADAECSSAVTEACQLESAKCKSVRTGECSKAKPPSASYRPGEAEKCLSAIGKAYKDNKFTPEEQVAIDNACALLFGGTKGHGVTCAGDYDCNLNDGLRCLKMPGEANGKCHAPEVVKGGDDCGEALVCDEGLFCTANDNICANLRGKDKSCSPTEPCAADLRCVEDFCIDKLDAGAECEIAGAHECKSGFCAKVGAKMQCVSNITFSPNEPVCLYDFGGQDPPNDQVPPTE